MPLYSEGKDFLINSARSIVIPIPHYPEKSIWEGRYKKVHSVWFHLHKAQKQEKLMTENRVFLLVGDKWLVGAKWEISGVGSVLFFWFGWWLHGCSHFMKMYWVVYLWLVYFSICLIYFAKNLLTGKRGLHMAASEPKEFMYFTHKIPSFF